VMSSEPDASVLRRSIDQPDCFALLFDRHFAQVYRYLRRRLGDELAAELAAETFLQAFRSRGRFTGDDASVLAWLYGIAANLVRMNHRAEERRLRAYARAASGLSASEPAIAIEDRLDAEASGRRWRWRWPACRPPCARCSCCTPGPNSPTRRSPRRSAARARRYAPA